jgi:hypothetical protein
MSMMAVVLVKARVGIGVMTSKESEENCRGAERGGVHRRGHGGKACGRLEAEFPFEQTNCDVREKIARDFGSYAGNNNEDDNGSDGGGGNDDDGDGGADARGK